MSLTGCSAIPAPYRERGQMAYETGKRIVGMAFEDLRPSQVLDQLPWRVGQPRGRLSPHRIGDPINSLVEPGVGLLPREQTRDVGADKAGGAGDRCFH